MTHVSRALAVVLVVVGALLVWAGTPTSLGSYTAKVTNTKNTAATNVWTATCVWQARNDSAYFFYDLDDASGTTAADTSGNNRPGTYTSAGVTYNDVAGPCTNDTQGKVITLNGSTGYVTGPQIAGAGPTDFTEEIWFKTNTTTGGKLMGLGTARTGASGTYDRHLYMNNDGKLTIGIYDGTARTVQTTASYNNNVWHHAVFTVATTGTYKGMRLYVDGNTTPVASTTTYFTSETGSNYYVRIGYDNLSGWTNVPTSSFFKGSLADAAFYNGVVLTPTQVAAHYNAGK